MRLGGLFEGYGGLTLAAQAVFDCTPAWFVENDPAAAAVLAHHHPNVPNHGDITAIDWTDMEPVDVLTAGWPCQDISNAGKRAGIEGERSGLWRHVADAVRVLRPRYVLLENVSAVVVRGLDTVHADLAALGFDTEWTCLPASAVGAPHRRDRFFLVAADATYHGHERYRPPRRRWERPTHHGQSATHAASDGRHQRGAEHARTGGRPDATQRRVAATDTDEPGPQRPEPAEGHDLSAWGDYGPAIARWEAILGRAAPTPTQRGQRGGDVLSPRFVEWLMGLPQGWVADVPDLSRNQQLKLLGNGVVPQQAAMAYDHLLGLLLTPESEVA